MLAMSSFGVTSQLLLQTSSDSPWKMGPAANHMANCTSRSSMRTGSTIS